MKSKKTLVKILIMMICMLSLAAMMCVSASAVKIDNLYPGEDTIPSTGVYDYPLWRWAFKQGTGSNFPDSDCVISGDQLRIRFRWSDSIVTECECGSCCPDGLWWDNTSETEDPILVNFKHVRENPIPVCVSTKDGVIKVEFGQFLLDGEYVEGVEGYDCRLVKSLLDEGNYSTFDYFYYVVTLDTNNGSCYVYKYEVYECSDCAGCQLCKVEGEVVSDTGVLLSIKATGNGSLLLDDRTIESLNSQGWCSVDSPLLEYLHEQSKSEGYSEGYHAGYEYGESCGWDDGYTEGLEEGQNSVDTDAIRQEGYTEGFTAGKNSVDTESIRQEGYTEGFTAGKNSVDTETIRQEGYSEGYDAGYEYGESCGWDDGYTEGFDDGLADGKNSVDTDAIRQEGYTEGFTAGKNSVDTESIRQEGYTEGFTVGKNSVDTETIRQEGYDTGYEYGYSVGWDDGYTEGQDSAYDEATYDAGYSNGYDAGYGAGYDEGYDMGYSDASGSEYQFGFDAGFESGYSEGFAEGKYSVDTEAVRQEGYNSGSADTKILIYMSMLHYTGVENPQLPNELQQEIVGATSGDFWYMQDEYMKGHAYRSFMPKIGLDPDSLIDLGPVTAMSWAELTGGMFESGVNEGYEAGYSIGYADGEANGELMTDGFKDMAFAIFEAPSVLVGSMLDFDFLGINLYGLLKALLTMAVVAAIVIVLIKFVM